MIVSFNHKGLEEFYHTGKSRKLPAQQISKIRNLLSALDAAETIDDMGAYPGWRLHPLKGDMKDYWSVTVSGNYRIIFKLKNGHASDVDYLDYH